MLQVNTCIANQTPSTSYDCACATARSRRKISKVCSNMALTKFVCEYVCMYMFCKCLNHLQAMETQKSRKLDINRQKKGEVGQT